MEILKEKPEEYLEKNENRMKSIHWNKYKFDLNTKAVWKVQKQNVSEEDIVIFLILKQMLPNTYLLNRSLQLFSQDYNHNNFHPTYIICGRKMLNSNASFGKHFIAFLWCFQIFSLKTLEKMSPKEIFIYVMFYSRYGLELRVLV